MNPVPLTLAPISVDQSWSRDPTKQRNAIERDSAKAVTGRGMGFTGDKLKKLTKGQEDRLTELFEMFWQCLPSGQGAKVAKGSARDAWIRKFKKVSEDNWTELFNTIKEGFLKQEAYRKKIIKQYPDERARKNAGVFLPSRPHMATFLNQERWKDEVRQLASEPEKVARTGCKVLHCESQGNHVVEGGSLCDWHWTKEYNRDHLRLLADSLDRMGLSRKKGEDMASWSKRCRDHIKGTEIGKVFSA